MRDYLISTVDIFVISYLKQMKRTAKRKQGKKLRIYRRKRVFSKPQSVRSVVQEPLALRLLPAWPRHLTEDVMLGMPNDG